MFFEFTNSFFQAWIQKVTEQQLYRRSVASIMVLSSFFRAQQTLTAETGNQIGSAFGATYLIGKTEDITREYKGEEDFFIAGLEWGEEKGADLLSSSLGYEDWYDFSQKDGSSLIDSAIDIAVTQKAVLAVISVGNDGLQHGPAVPGDAHYSLSVGAVSANRDVTSFSSRGPSFDGRYKVYRF